MKREESYAGLSTEQLRHHRYLIFIIEAASYCESNKKDNIRRAHHKKLCDQTLCEFTNRMPSEFGGSYKSIMNSQSYEHLFHITRDENKSIDLAAYSRDPTRS
jgi:hypothetical protein